jgi:rhamnogalacturonan endolyase
VAIISKDMPMRWSVPLITLVTTASLLSVTHAAERQKEPLDRGLTADSLGGARVYLSWRLLDDDPKGVAFNVYREADPPRKINSELLRDTTDLVDEAAPAGTVAYSVCPVVDGREGPRARVKLTVDPAAKPTEAHYRSFPLEGKATAQKVGIADLDGDGRYDLVVKSPGENVDPYINYWKRSPDTFKLDAFDADGRKLWRHDLGWSIEQGIWYSPFVVYDLDGDGRAEVAVKTGEGDPREPDGRVHDGPEWLSILDGRTGKEVTRVAWPDRKPFYDFHKESRDSGYNYASRNQIGIAYLDGVHPHLIVERGTYSLQFVRAYRLEAGRLREVWRWDNTTLGKAFRGQGAHGMHAADVDGDGREEIILGSLVLDDDGKPLWTTGMGHPDHAYVGDLDPSRPGLEIYYGYETPQKKNGMCMVDAATGKLLWGHDQPTRHVHGQGLCSDIDSSHPGSECYSADSDNTDKKGFSYARLRTARGVVISDADLGGFAPYALYWDADLQRELMQNHRIVRYNGPARYERIPGTVLAIADILGDWREEVVTTTPGEVRVYSTTLPARDRRVTLMRDPIYRAGVAHVSMGYFQVPTLSFDLATSAESTR